MDPITSFDDWVRRQRKALDMTQAELAARVSCAVVTIRKIEQATRRPSREMAEALADALAIPAAQRETFLQMARHQFVEPDAIPPAVSGAPPAFRTVPPRTGDEPMDAGSFVGRGREMAQLETHLTSVLNGSGRIVLIAGEAGFGKTTLMARFARQALATYPDLIVADGHCEAFAGAGTPYLPFRDLMAMLTCDVENPSQESLYSQEQILRLWSLLPYTTQALIDQGPDLIDVVVSGAQLRQRVHAHPIAATAHQAQLEAILHQRGQPRDVAQRRLFEQILRLFRTLAVRQPLLLLLDDLQWIDRASADLLLYMASRLSGSRVLLLGAYRRSELEPGEPSGHTTDQQTNNHALTALLHKLRRRYGDVEIDLDQSNAQTGRAFVDALLDSETNRMSEAFRARLFQRTRGHPLFTVELLRDMQERNDLVRDEEGRWIEGGDIDWDLLPARVEAVISRRIGRLPPVIQEGLKVASVEGETFTAEVVARIVGIDGWEMVQQLSGIAGRQHRLIVGQGQQRLGSQLLSRYRFGHILFQHYLYGNLDSAERAYLHEAVGRALEELAADQTEVVAVQLARHYQAAGLTVKAVEYLAQAGRQALAVSAHEEAIAHHVRALALVGEFPATSERARLELQLYTDLGVSYKITKGFAAPEVEWAYDRAQLLCEQVEDPLARACVLWGLASVYTVRGDMTKARTAAEACMRFSATQEDPLLQVTGYCTLGSTLIHTGRLQIAKTNLQRALRAYAPAQHRTHIFLSGLDLGVFSLAHLAQALCLLGYPDQALRRAQEAVKLAATTSHPFSNVSALSYLTMLHQWRGDWTAVQELASTVRRLCDEHDIPYYAAWAGFLQGWAMVEPHTIEQGIQLMEHSLVDLQRMRVGLRRPYYLCLLAEKYGEVGRIEEGLRLVEDGLAQALAQEQTLYEPEIARVEGELLWKQAAEQDRIEACFRRAIKVAQHQEAKLLELRGTTSLARLYQEQGRGAKARSALAEVIHFFDEGLDLSDLQTARVVLEELS